MLPRTRWAIGIMGALAMVSLLAAAFVMADTTSSVTVRISNGGGGPRGTGTPCDHAIEAAGAPVRVWSALLHDGMRFEIPLPAEVGRSYGYRIEVLGNATFADVRDESPGAWWRSSETMCVEHRGANPSSTLGVQKLARGEGALYAAFFPLRAR